MTKSPREEGRRVLFQTPENKEEKQKITKTISDCLNTCLDECRDFIKKPSESSGRAFSYEVIKRDFGKIGGAAEQTITVYLSAEKIDTTILTNFTFVYNPEKQEFNFVKPQRWAESSGHILEQKEQFLSLIQNKNSLTGSVLVALSEYGIDTDILNKTATFKKNQKPSKSPSNAAVCSDNGCCITM